LNYKQWLPITQENLNTTDLKDPRIKPTKANKTTIRKKKALVQDEFLDIPKNQDFNNSAYNMVTKIKNNR